MKSYKQRPFTTGAAVGAAAMLAIGGGLVASAQAPFGRAVNPPAGPLAAQGGPGSFADIVARVAPAVVSVDVVRKPGPSPIAMDGDEPSLPFDFGSPDQGGPFGFSFKWVNPQAPGGKAPPIQASGSGFFISPEGYIVTNNHVVDGAEKITVRTSDDRRLTATVIGRDPATDLAVLKVDGGPFPYVSFENRAQPRVGDWVVAVGNPFGLGGTATAGIVSALARPNVSGSSFVDYMQIDAPINRGNSGGPTFDIAGHVVGVNTAIYSPSGGSVGIGFDIPSEVAASVTRQLIEHGKVTRGYIGATVQALSPELSESLGLGRAKGALVDQLTPGGPAQAGGLKSGDVIVAVDGRSVDDASALTRQVALAHPGDVIHLTVVRDGGQREVDIRSGLRPSEASLASNQAPDGDDESGGAGPAALGMQLTPDPDGGLLVQQVDPDSDAAAKGLRQGDVILRAGVDRVRSAADLAAAAGKARQAGRKSLPLLVARGGERLYVPVQVNGGEG